MTQKHLYNHPSDMEPLWPTDRAGRLAGLGLEVIRRSERLRDRLHPITRRGVVDLVRSMNSYYSNLIEDHRTMPRDIDSALRQEFSHDAQRRSLQQMHWAHVETQRWMESAVIKIKPSEICGAEFLCRLHHEFYTRLSEEFRWVEDAKGRRHPVEPGQLRQSPVSVAIHLPPVHGKLAEKLTFLTGVRPPFHWDCHAPVTAASARAIGQKDEGVRTIRQLACGDNTP